MQDSISRALVLAACLCLSASSCSSQAPTKKPLSAYTDADLERLSQQWEDNDEDKDPEEAREQQPKSPNINLKTMDLKNPDALLKATKRGQPMMIFTVVAGVKNQIETEGITQVWQDGLFNAHIETKRFMVSQDRVVFTIFDGALAWQAKEFLVKQERCAKVTLEGQDFPGAAAKKDEL